MSVRREPRRNPRNGKVRQIMIADMTITFPDGSKDRLREVVPVSNKRLAEQWERQRREELLRQWEQRKYGAETQRKEVPTFDEWFNGRYWHEWVVGKRNKPGTIESKKAIYKKHLKPVFGQLRLDKIGVAEVASFRGDLVEQGLADKTINNILAVLSKPLRYAAEVELIAKAPKVGLFKVEPPEIVFWEYAEYARILAATKREGEMVYAAVCLAGEAGLRVGEVKAVRWREDVDMIARTITVNQQTRKGITGTPKGRTRRTVPMTDTLYQALRALSVVREGLVIRGVPGQARSDENQIKNMMYRVCRLAGLPERGWHTMRHSFGTHAAMLGVNPWRLMAWLGHKRMEETMRYVHIASDHMREAPPEVLAAVDGELDPDRKVIRMLGGRVRVPAVAESRQQYGNTKRARHKLAGS
jgi:integrase